MFLSLIFLFLTTVFWVSLNSFFGAQLDLKLLYIFAIGYAEGLGATPIPKFNVYGSLVLLICLACIWKQSTSARNEIQIFGSFLLLALGTYYVGRAVPHNITAVMPIIILTFIMMLSNFKDDSFSKATINRSIIVFACMLLTSAYSNLTAISDAWAKSDTAIEVPEMRSQDKMLDDIRFDILPEGAALSIVSLERHRFLYDPKGKFPPSIPMPPMLLVNPLPAFLCQDLY